MGISVSAKTSQATHPHHSSRKLTETLSVPASSHWLCYERGKRLTKKGDYAAALDSFNLALDLEPNEPQIWVFRGVVLTHLNHYEAALVSFNKALAIASNHCESWIFRGAVLSYLNRAGEARSSYAIALRLQQQGVEKREDYPMWVPARELSAC